jgi:hypothetical protein
MRAVVVIACLAAAGVVIASLGQAQPVATPLPGLPQYTVGYKAWFKINRTPIPQSDGDAHPGTKNVFASKRAVRGRYPVGTVIVKEVFRRGQRYPYVIAAMRKLKGRTAHNGWVMIEWTRRSERTRFSVLAQGEICYSCHVGAKATDYVFTRR